MQKKIEEMCQNSTESSAARFYGEGGHTRPTPSGGGGVYTPHGRLANHVIRQSEVFVQMAIHPSSNPMPATVHYG